MQERGDAAPIVEQGLVFPLVSLGCTLALLLSHPSLNWAVDLFKQERIMQGLVKKCSGASAPEVLEIRPSYSQSTWLVGGCQE